MLLQGVFEGGAEEEAGLAAAELRGGIQVDIEGEIRKSYGKADQSTFGELFFDGQIWQDSHQVSGFPDERFNKLPPLATGCRAS